MMNLKKRLAALIIYYLLYHRPEGTGANAARKVGTTE